MENAIEILIKNSKSEFVKKYTEQAKLIYGNRY